MAKSRFCKYVALKRKEIGLTQRQLADALCYTPQAISRFESIDSAFPMESMPDLCKTLGCSLDDIYLRNEETHYAPLPFELSELPSLLRNKREQYGKTQNQIGNACGCTAKSVRNYENGAGSISYQFIEAFCECLGILPSELIVTPVSPQIAPEIPPENIKNPANRVRFYAIGGSMFALALLVAILIPVIKSNVDRTSSQNAIVNISSQETSTLITTAKAEETTTAPKYGLGESGGVPGFIQLEQSKPYFGHIGDTIELTLSDAYGDCDLSDIRPEDIEYSLVIPSDTLSVSFTHTGVGKTTMTLLGAQNGEGSSLNIDIGGNKFYNVGFFAYHDQTPVYLSGDTNHKRPFVEGGLYYAGSQETTVYLNETNYVSYNIFFMGAGGTYAYPVGPNYMVGDASLQVPRITEHAWGLDIHTDEKYVIVPKQIEVDDALLIYWVEVQGINGSYWFALTPLHIHIIH